MDIRKELNYLRAMLSKEMIVFSRYPILLVSTFVTPLFLVLIFSFTSLTFVDNPSDQQIRFIATSMYLGILAYMFIQVSIIGATSIRDEQQQGTLESLFLTPATKITNVVAKLMIQIVITSFNAVILYFAILVFIGPMDFSNFQIVLPLFFLMLIQFVGLGLIYAALTLKFKETIVIASNFSIFLIMIFSAMFYSFDTIPEGPMKLISLILPTSYAIDALRTSLLGYPPGFPELLPFNYELIIILVTSISLFFFGIYFYLRIERQARKLGTLLEY